jgi:P27 family predicted phage terminase small subunit
MANLKRKPTRVKELEGNPGRRPLPKDEPQPNITEKIPRPPRHLSNPAKKEWKSMAAKLHRLGLLTEIDTAVLALYCQAYGRWIEAEEKLEKTGLVIKTTNGNIVHSPYASIARTSMLDCHKYAVEFGMTPSARAKVSVSTPEKKSKFAGLVTFPGGKKE